MQNPFDEVHDVTFEWLGLGNNSPATTRGEERACEEFRGYVVDVRPQGILAGACMFAGLLVLMIGGVLTLAAGPEFEVARVVKLVGWVLEVIGVWTGVRMLRLVWRMSAFDGSWGRGDE